MKLAFDLPRILLWCVGAFLLTLLSGLPLMTPPSAAQSQIVQDSPSIEIVEGWQYRWGDSPLNKAGIPTWTYDDASSPNWKPFKVPIKLRRPQRQGVIWLRVKLPQGQWKYPSLDRRGIPYIEAYLGNKQLDKLAEVDAYGKFRIISNFWPIIPLDSEFQGKFLYFKIYSIKAGFIPIGIQKGIRIGSQINLFKMLVQETIIKFVLGCFFICIGLFPLLIAVRREERKAYLSFGLFAVSTGIFTIFENEITATFFNLPEFVDRLIIASLYLMPVGIGIFFEQISGAGYKSIVRRLWQIHFIYAVVAVILVELDLVPGSSTINIFAFLFIVNIIITLINSVAIALKGNIEARLFTAGFTIFSIAGIHDLLTIVNITYTQQEFYYWGLFIFILFIAFILERRFTEARNRLQTYAKELESNYTALQQIDKLKDEFLAKTSHELRTPLNGIIGIAESMIDGATGLLTSPQIANLSMVVSSGKRLANLVNDILDFAKLKHKNIELQIKPVDMRTMTDIVLAISQPIANNKSLQLVNQISSRIPPVEADENRVQQILYNLIGNAIKFTEAGVIEVSAEVISDDSFLEDEFREDDETEDFLMNQGDNSSAFKSPYLAITVSDTGIGIPAHKLNQIFESFEQADGSTARQYGGTGLGLAITKQLVELHGGEIRLESTVGRGSRFTFTLPLSRNSVERRQEVLPIPVTTGELVVKSVETKAIASVQPYNNGNFKILIVDDEPVNLQVLINHLSLQNYAIAQASNGLEALEILENGFQADLIVLDVMMPRMTGYEVCQKIREKFPAHELPIVFLTANDRVSDLVEWANSGANDYLTKPVSKNELLARIKTHIQLAKTNVAYGRFVPREFLRFLEKESIVDVKLGDQVQKEMTVLFADIRSFTALSENMSPKENFNFINSYLSRVGPVIRNHNGFIDKYIGDAVMALFPENAEDAVKAAINMQKQVSLYNSHRHKSGYPSIAIGIGMHTGILMLGTIGEEQRMESTVISDAVNLASRLEGLTKLYGAGILISERTLSRLDEPQNYNFRFLDRVRVKGKKSPVAVFEIYDGDPDSTIELKTQTRADFERGIYLYYQQKFAEALPIFQNLLQINERDKAVMLYIQRCEMLQKHGITEEWDKIETLEQKL